jgi:DNA helicase-2/ATP-dependent DNA helicase PcrA
MENGVFPANNSEDLEEERRIAYVGVTRAKQRLYLTTAKSRFVYGEQRFSQESVFVGEMYKNILKEVPSLPEKPGGLKIGQKKKHSIYGSGIVIKISDDHYEVAFPLPYGIKKFKKKD